MPLEQKQPEREDLSRDLKGDTDIEGNPRTLQTLPNGMTAMLSKKEFQAEVEAWSEEHSQK